MDQQEISDKIRKAIKAKLTELGSYIDDELPDYIMVMIANKKDMSQMASDLELFLSENAAPFTTWLENLLERLQSVSQAVLKPEVPPAPVQQPELAPSNTTHTDATQSNAAPAQETDGDDAALTLYAQNDEFTDEEAEDEVTITTRPPPIVDVKPPVKGEPADGKPNVKPKKSVPQTHISQSQVVTTQKKKISTRGDSDILLPRAEVAPSRRPAPSRSVMGTTSPASSPPGRQHSPVRRSPDRRRAPASSRLGISSSSQGRIGSDRSRYRAPYNRDRDEYSPERGGGRYSHAYRDRDRSRERHRSRERSRDRSREREMDRVRVRPASHRGYRFDDEAEDRSSVRRLNRVASRIQSVRAAPVIEEFSETDEEETASRPQVSSVASVVKISERKSSVPESLQANKKLLLKAMADVTKSLGPPDLGVIREEPKEPAGRRSAKQRIGGQENTAVQSDLRRSRSPCERLPRRPRLPSRSYSRSRSRSPSIDDSELLEVLQLLKSRRKRAAVRRAAVSLREKEVRGGDRRLSSHAEDEAPLSDKEEIPEVEEVLPVKPRSAKQRLGVRAESPKFVVTLDAVSDMQQLLPNCNNLEDVELDEIDSIDRQIDTPSETGVQLNLVSSERSLSNKASIPCRYLPNCKFGTMCQYQHPTPTSPTKPTNLTAGGLSDTPTMSQTVVTAALCRFDAACTKLNCPYTHTAKGSAGHSIKPASQTVCRFFPKCTNMNCPYMHPKPCKFGIACLRRTSGCMFTHPSLPTKPQLRWTRSGTATSAS